MRVFAMSDLHLPFGVNKPMDIFGGWDNYTERIEQNWNSIVTDDDVVVVPGDICWAMSLTQAIPDFGFISRMLKGTKIILKGNHDYWWTTLNKMNRFFEDNSFNNITILHNDTYVAGEIAICGTRGWINDDGQPQDTKLLLREAARLETSIEKAKSTGKEPVVFIHYPPIYGGEKNFYILEVLKKHNIRRCFYGHVHGSLCFSKAFQGGYDGTEFRMISADYVKFTPVLVQE